MVSTGAEYRNTARVGSGYVGGAVARICGTPCHFECKGVVLKYLVLECLLGECRKKAGKVKLLVASSTEWEECQKEDMRVHIGGRMREKGWVLTGSEK